MVLLHSLLLLQCIDIFSAAFISRAIIEKLGKRICHNSKIFFQSIGGRQIKPLDLCSAVRVTLGIGISSKSDQN
uniref:Putative secreted protein n=1 Tax=Ixodes ricinus TaxID=34613 RepID=A0A147BKI7_IXORI